MTNLPGRDLNDHNLDKRVFLYIIETSARHYSISMFTEIVHSMKTLYNKTMSITAQQLEQNVMNAVDNEIDNRVDQVRMIAYLMNTVTLPLRDNTYTTYGNAISVTDYIDEDDRLSLQEWQTIASVVTSLRREPRDKVLKVLPKAISMARRNMRFAMIANTYKLDGTTEPTHISESWWVPLDHMHKARRSIANDGFTVALHEADNPENVDELLSNNKTRAKIAVRTPYRDMIALTKKIDQEFHLLRQLVDTKDKEATIESSVIDQAKYIGVVNELLDNGTAASYIFSRLPELLRAMLTNGRPRRIFEAAAIRMHGPFTNNDVQLIIDIDRITSELGDHQITFISEIPNLSNKQSPLGIALDVVQTNFDSYERLDSITQSEQLTQLRDTIAKNIKVKASADNVKNTDHEYATIVALEHIKAMVN